jgi:endonuclease
MALYEKPVRLLMRDMVADIGLKKEDILTRERVISWFAQKYPRVKEGTISAHLIRLSINATSRAYYSAKPGDDDLFFQLDGAHFRLYNASTDPTPIYEKPQSGSLPPPEETDEHEPPSEFAYETDLRDFLAKNLSALGPGLRLYHDEGITGVEFPAGGRFIDILAVDAHDNLVVVELKVSRGYDRVVGQLLRYMAWVGNHQAEPGQNVRGIIVAREISEDLLLACSTLPNVELFEYQLSVTLRKVQLNATSSHTRSEPMAL